jgi:hypothetical protein
VKRRSSQTDSASQNGALETDTRDISAPEISPGEIGAREIETAQILIPEIQIRQKSTDEIVRRIQTCRSYEGRKRAALIALGFVD